MIHQTEERRWKIAQVPIQTDSSSIAGGRQRQGFPAQVPPHPASTRDNVVFWNGSFA